MNLLPGRPIQIVILCYISFIWMSCTNESVRDYPLEIFDDNLQLDLVAESPAIVTPLGIAFDAHDQLFVLESHTHSPPSEYKGPKSDRIKRGVDYNADGLPDEWMIFAEGIVNGANLTIDETGKIFLTTKRYVLVFEDRDGDGTSDLVDTLLFMDLPENIYDHAGLLGIALGDEDWIYVSRGNLSSKAWRLRCRSGSVLEGYGIGGIVVRFKKDGSQLELIASGFWNPFDLKFTRDGRLLLTDNDPDSRGPNRLIEIVRGGDYGFKCLYGGSGLHPYVAWNGELPGTLPYAAPLGEAPCALLDAGFTNFGDDYEKSILVNIWEEKNIVRIPLEERGSTVTGKPEILVQGDTSFHPVALATDSQGNLYISDWVLRKYPNHGSGKIWRISAKRKTIPKPGYSKRIDHLNKHDVDPTHFSEQLLSGDAFEKAIIRDGLTAESTLPLVIPYLKSADPVLRLEALLVYLKVDWPLENSILISLLQDQDLRIRKMALIYVGRKMRVDLGTYLNTLLAEGYVDPELLDIYLATIQHLQPEFIENFQNKSGLSADKQKHPLPERFIESLITNPQIRESIRALALPRLENPAEHHEELLALLRSARDPSWTTQLMHALEQVSSQQVVKEFLNIAMDSGRSAEVRAQAISGMFNQPTEYCPQLMTLLTCASDDIVQYALIKFLTKCREDETLTSQVEGYLTQVDNTNLTAVWQHDPLAAREVTKEAYARAINDQGNVTRGRLIFENRSLQCQTCHRVAGWGGMIGPDLSNVGRSKSKKQLVDAILYPSLEISPEWQGWYVIDQKGQKHLGRQIDVHEGRAELMNLSGEFDNYDAPMAFGIMENSIMPEGLHYPLTPNEFNDLIAYLASLN